MKRLRRLAITQKDITYNCDEVLNFIINNCEENYIYFYVHDCLNDDRVFEALCDAVKEKVDSNTTIEELKQIIKITIIEKAKEQQQMRYEME